MPGRQILSRRVKISIFDSSSSGPASMTGQTGGRRLRRCRQIARAPKQHRLSERKPARPSCQVQIHIGIHSPRGERWAKDLPRSRSSRQSPPPVRCPAHLAGANHADGADHGPGGSTNQPLSSCPNTALRLVLAVRRGSARRLRSALSMVWRHDAAERGVDVIDVAEDG